MKKYKYIAIILISLLFFSVINSHSASNKVALVIGNGDYKEIPLRNPARDANDMASALRKLGFSVIIKTNATQNEMEDAIRGFGKRLSIESIGLFYYSGHGLQTKGINYLIPIGAKIYSDDEIKYKAVEAGMVLDKMENAGSRTNIVILDACRSNPFKSFRSIKRGLAPMMAPRGTFIAYATAPGTVAFDGTEKNSPYTKHLLKMIRNPNFAIEKVFKQVRVAVMSETNNRQVPWEASSLTGDDFYFAKKYEQTEQPLNNSETSEKYYYESGELEFVFSMINGKREGIGKGYYKSGKLESTRIYKNGKIEGIKKHYYESGELKWEYNHINGKIEGITKGYYKSGKLKSTWTYKNGELNGKYKAYYENGNLKNEGIK
ncbi:caspase family protein [Desulfococcaceae bacterium HSG7]|nr:caspase family protein [Desulfococcaceae bacterium HSG7]